MRRTLLMSAALKRHQRRASAAEMRHQFLLFVLALAACGPVTLPENATVNINTGAMAGAAAPMAGAGAAPDGSVVRAARSTTTRNPEVIDADAGVDPMDDDAGEPDREPLPRGQPNDSDFDADGIPDRIDVCPVDKSNDTDRDGKCDSQDPCPNDALDDRDFDGLCDSDDPCPKGGRDADEDGICDVDDVCPRDAMNDRDGDGVCDSYDDCPLDLHDDSDRDGSCDSADRCPGFDDKLDADKDSTPDACDRCSGKSDADDDKNGYADACDQVLWVRTEDTELRVASSSYPIGEAVLQLLLLRETQSLTASAQVGVSLTPEDSETSIPFTRLKAFEQVLRDESVKWGLTQISYLRVRDSTRDVAKFSAIEKPNLAGRTFMRFAFSGYVANDGRTRFRWELRGY